VIGSLSYFEGPTSAVVMDTAAVVTDVVVTVRDTAATVRDTTSVVAEQCAGGGCVPLRCGEVRVEPDPVCEGAEVTLTAGPLCGEGVVSVGWALDGDTVADESGDPLVRSLSAGAHEVTAFVEDSCVDPGPQRCSSTVSVTVVPGFREEVSAVRLGEPPLRVAPRGGQLIVEHDPAATA
jgi:hypothetical protein